MNFKLHHEDGITMKLV